MEPSTRLHQHAVHAVASRRNSPPLRALRRIARSYLDLDGNRSFVPELNGEARLLRVLASYGAGCLFDVGANVGNWTRMALRLVPGAGVHAFELVPDTAAQLMRSLSGHSSVVVNALGLDRKDGEVQVRYFPTFSEGSSVTGTNVDLPFEWRTARVTTGDAYCAKCGIDRIDFVKLDVEGAEDRVLDGFAETLRAGRIGAVQFEYGVPNIDSHYLLADFHRRFAKLGYRIGKLFPNHVDFRPYDRTIDEDFRGPNYVAVRQDLRGLIASLQ